MSNTQHTPGPWTFALSDDARVDDRIVGANGSTVVRGSIGYTPDAALLAAAPALLEALRTIVANASSVQLDPQWAVQVARAAIRQATGQE